MYRPSECEYRCPLTYSKSCSNDDELDHENVSVHELPRTKANLRWWATTVRCLCAHREPNARDVTWIPSLLDIAG